MTAQPPTVIVTRAQADASAWCQALVQQGWAARSLPLLAIHPVADPGPVRQAWQALASYQAVMGVSANALQGLATLGPDPGAPNALRAQAPQTRFWVTGRGSARAALALGVPLEQLDQPAPDAPQWDSEALWAVVAPQVRAGTRVLIVRGSDAKGRVSGRDWLSRQLQDRGAQVDTVCAYARGLPVWSEAQRLAAARAAQDGSIWLFSSSEAVRHLSQLLPATDWRCARSVATHARIAQTLRDIGFGTVRLSHPQWDALVASIESMHYDRPVSPGSPP